MFRSEFHRCKILTRIVEMKMRNRIVLLLAAVLALVWLSCSNSDKPLFGTWTFVKDQSTDLATWRYRTPQLVIRQDGEQIVIKKNWLQRKKVAYAESLAFVPGGAVNEMPVQKPFWYENWYMGVLAKVGSTMKVSGAWQKPGKDLVVDTEQVVEVSQGDATIQTRREFSLDRRGNTLTVTEKRSSRPTPVKLVFQRAEAF